MNTYMPSVLKPYYYQELDAYHEQMQRNRFSQAWHHLERAHIIGQAYPYEHSEVHWLMLRFGFRIKNLREILGQIPRLLVGGVKSFVGKIPVGNTGGADVPPLQPMEIPEDLKQVLNRRNA